MPRHKDQGAIPCEPDILRAVSPALNSAAPTCAKPMAVGAPRQAERGLQSAGTLEGRKRPDPSLAAGARWHDGPAAETPHYKA